MARKRKNVWKGLAAGAAGGAVATLSMSGYQALWNKFFSPHIGQSPAPGQAASKVAESVAQRPLEEAEQKKAGPVVHWLFGTSVGALYGGLAEAVPATAVADGVPYGAAVWLGADEFALPKLGLSPPPNVMPARIHLYGLTAHLVYGAALDGTRRLIRNFWR